MQESEKQVKELVQELAHQQASAQTAVGKLDALEQESLRLSGMQESLLAKRVQIEPKISETQLQVNLIQESISEAESELSSHEAVRSTFEAELTVATEGLTTNRIEQARAEQRLEALQAALNQCTRNHRERLQAVAEANTEVIRYAKRLSEAELNILDLTSQLAEDYLRSEAKESALEELAAQAATLRANRLTSQKRLESVTRSIDKLSQRVQSTQVECQRTQESIDTLRQRLAEDYQIDFEELQQATRITAADERTQLQSEAARLRQDIASVGEVNLAALNELDELQSRYDFLNGQYEDLQAAKESLQRIIQKINTDSRRLFMETLEIIRQNFQKLYRKSFGGGNADIVLEDPDDVLECGIDIIATPPGKTALSNSLLSGGEKALTAVALLLAIFQFRPSPFCVLDEVDAPFDEANIGRFVNVLTEFLDWTKFIVVTHSKKTMTAANTLYGVTMQESGISKQVAVRFENVKENGEIIEDEDAEQAPRRRAA